MDDDFFARVRRWSRFRKVTIENMLEQAMPDATTPPIMSYNGWRSRRCLPRADDALKIAKQLGVTLEFLVSGEDPKFEELVKQDEVLKECEMWQSLQGDLSVIPDSQRRRIIAEVHTLAEEFRSQKA